MRKPFPRRRTAAIAALSLIAAGAAPALADGWRTYANARFGTSVRVPAAMFPNPGRESANGDGVTFNSADGTARLLVWGSLGLDGMEPADLLSMAREGVDVVTAATTADGYALEAGDGTRSWFERCRIGAGADRVIHCVRLEVPAGDARRHDAVARRIAGSLAGP